MIHTSFEVFYTIIIFSFFIPQVAPFLLHSSRNRQFDFRTLWIPCPYFPILDLKNSVDRLPILYRLYHIAYIKLFTYFWFFLLMICTFCKAVSVPFRAGLFFHPSLSSHFEDFEYLLHTSRIQPKKEYKL